MTAAGLLAITPDGAERLLAAVAAVATCACLVAAAWPLAAAAAAPRDDTDRTPADRQVREALRRRSATYRWFESLVDDLAARVRGKEFLFQLQKDLDLTEPEAGWRAAEYFAVRRVEGAWVFFGGLAVGFVGFDSPAVGVLTGLAAGYGYPFLAANRVAARARAVRTRIEARLPLASDLIALVLEGANLPHALVVARDENAGHPLGDELRRALAGYARNPNLQAALRGLGDRVGSLDVSEFVFMVVTALDRGTEVREALQNMAERLRVRRIQRLEREAELATVKIAGPGLVVMVACLVVIMAPFLLIGYTQGR